MTPPGDRQAPTLTLTEPATPTVLVVAGHDPGGAGIQADIETLLALRCRAAPLITCLTAQNSRIGRARLSTDPTFLALQANCLLEDIEAPAACKIGMIPDIAVLEAVLRILDLLPHDTPVVLDPVLGATTGGALVDPDLPAALAETLLPRALISTPNAREAARLGQPAADPARRSRWTLVTGADEPGDPIEHILYRDDVVYAKSKWTRLPGTFHGSGCSLASALAAFLARGITVPDAVDKALHWTDQALREPVSRGNQHLLPGRPRE